MKNIEFKISEFLKRFRGNMYCFRRKQIYETKKEKEEMERLTNLLNKPINPRTGGFYQENYPHPFV